MLGYIVIKQSETKMRLLFEIDLKDYKKNGSIFSRPSSRAIYIKDGLIGLIYSRKYQYYKFPGGGIEANESNIQALIREVKEETGLAIKEESIKEYGYVHRVQKGIDEDIFIQDNFYYFVDCEDKGHRQTLDLHEIEEDFIFVFVKPMDAIRKNKENLHNYKNPTLITREVKVLELLINEKYLK